MISKSLSRKTLAAFVSVAVLSVYSMVALAGAKVASGELSVSGQVRLTVRKLFLADVVFRQHGSYR